MFHCVIICLLRHCSVLGFDFSSFVCYVTILFLKVFDCFIVYHVTIGLLFLQGFHCFIICLLRHCSFSASIVPSSVCNATILFLQGFHCSVICLLRHCSVLGFSCLFVFLLRFQGFHCFLIF